MGGEDLPSVALDERGISRDRWFAVRDSEGHFASGKNTRRFRHHDEVFQYSAATTGDDVRVTHGDGGSWLVGDPDLYAHLSENMGEQVTVSAEQTIPHQDMGSLSLIGTATLQWCADQWGLNADPRRLRVNIVIETSEPFIEESWVGCSASLGAAGLDFVKNPTLPHDWHQSRWHRGHGRVAETPRPRTEYVHRCICECNESRADTCRRTHQCMSVVN